VWVLDAVEERQLRAVGLAAVKKLKASPYNYYGIAT